MTQPFRTDSGGLIDRGVPLRFRWNGRELEGYRGDTLASALLANGVRVVGRSFKYHRPRGIWSCGAEEPNALVQFGAKAHGEPNIRATRLQLFDGLEARSQNHWPALGFDLLALNNLIAPVLSAGFYYKTFMAPARWWPHYEHWIRKAAGLGRAPVLPDSEHYAQRHAHCDVLVVGAGPTGLMAATAAAATGARVILCEETSRPGGWLKREQAMVEGMIGADWARRAAENLAARPNVSVLFRTCAFGYYDHNLVALAERRIAHDGPRQCLWRVRARRVVLACGAIERPIVFAGNDLPGVMLAGAARGFLNQFGVLPGRRAVIFTANDSAWRSAFDLHDAGVEIAALVDTRRELDAGLCAELRRRQIPLFPGHAVSAARGFGRLRGVRIRALDATAGAAQKLDCDLLCVSGGWSPAVHLHAQSGGRCVYDASIGAFVPGEAKQAAHSAGAARGVFALPACLADGAEAGRQAAAACGHQSGTPPHLPDCSLPADSGTGMVIWESPVARGKRFVDLQNDVTANDLRQAVQEGYRSVEHLKRYTTLGMGTDQGKTSNIPGMALLAAARGEDIASVGTTTFRPPYVPITLGVLAGPRIGAHLAPIRRTALHALHAAAGAVFTGNGLWLRPQYYPRPGEKPAAAVAREAAAVRADAGMADVSTLGKFELRGPDAAEFLRRACCTALDGLAPGRGRYALLLREDGMVLDDGTVTRLGPERFFLTCSSGHAEEVREHLEYLLHACWPELRAQLADVSEHRAAIAVAGPNSMQRLRAAGFEADVAIESLPYMGSTPGRLEALPLRLLRASYAGDLGFELYLRARDVEAAWRRLAAAGFTPYGLDAMDVLRIEKGFIAAGAEADGRATPADLGLQRLLRTDGEFIGRHGLARPALAAPDRPQLVGLEGLVADQPIREGAQLIDDPAARGFGASRGRVSSAAWSPLLGRYVALGLLAGGRARHGDTIYMFDPLRDPGGPRPLRVTAPCAFDPDGTRMRA